MGFTFTDKYKFAKGTSIMRVSDPATGKILFSDTATQTSNVEPNINMGEVRGGLMNGILTMIPQEPGMTINVTSAQYSLIMKAKQLGAEHGYGFPTRVCTTVTGAEGKITVPISTTGTPVAGPGYDSVFCYVQVVGAKSEIINDGVAYAIDPTTGIVSGYTATNGTTYKVHFWVNKATTEYVRVSNWFDPAVVHVEIETPIFANESGDPNNKGTQIGTHITVIPYVKLGGNGGMNGDQTGNDTTSVSGTAISYQQSVVVADCEDCSATAGDLCYYLYVPCDDAGMIEGMVFIGGEVELPASTSTTLKFYLIVGGQLAPVDTAHLTCTMSTALTGTSVTNAGVLTAGSTTGNAEVTATYSDGSASFTCPVNVTVTQAST